jgi:hypothetical protein
VIAGILALLAAALVVLANFLPLASSGDYDVIPFDFTKPTRVWVGTIVSVVIHGGLLAAAGIPLVQRIRSAGAGGVLLGVSALSLAMATAALVRMPEGIDAGSGFWVLRLADILGGGAAVLALTASRSIAEADASPPGLPTPGIN